MARITVSNASQLNSAIKSSGNGDQIVLKSGNYGSISINSIKKNITLTSENGGNPATLSSLVINKSSGVDVEGLKFTGSGTGVTVRSSQNVSIEDSTFFGNTKGVAVNSSSAVTLNRNDFTKMNNDGIALSGVNGAQITGNQIRDMNAKGSQHHDGIQIHPTSGASSNIVIRGNVIDTNDTNTQAIYMGSGTTHRNIDIENNTITAGHKFGIKIAATVAGLDIKNNVVIQDPALKSGKGGHTPEIDVSRSSSGVTITGNTAHEINASGNISGNKMVGIGTNAVASGTNTNWNSNSDTDTDSGWNSGGATVLDGDTVRGWTKKVINGFDLDDGDELKFQDYDKGTFKHKAGGNHLEVAGNGTSGTVDSAADLAELIDASSDITATKNGSTLVLRISQDDGTHAIRLNNMGDIDYNAGAAASGSGSSSNSGSSVVLDGDTVRGWTKKVINGFDLDDGDELRFQDYDKGTFKHKAGGNYLDVARNGQSGTVDSAADLKELIDSSSDIRATKNGDTLVLRISQDDGTHAIRLNNMDDIDFFL